MMLENDCAPPWAFALPLNSRDFGTSRWQLIIELYTFPGPPKGRAMPAYGPERQSATPQRPQPLSWYADMPTADPPRCESRRLPRSPRILSGCGRDALLALKVATSAAITMFLLREYLAE